MSCSYQSRAFWLWLEIISATSLEASLVQRHSASSIISLIITITFYCPLHATSRTITVITAANTDLGIMSAPDNAEPTESRSSFESQSRLQPAVRDHPHPSIFPLPTEAIFRQPQQSHIENSSRSSSSRTKRKRGAAIDDGSDTSHHASLTRASSTSDFSNTMKAQLRAEYRNKCWHCGASPADVCHIIGNRDNTVSSAFKLSTRKFY